MAKSIKLVSLGIRFLNSEKNALASAGCELRQYGEVFDLEAADRDAADADTICASGLWLRRLPPGFVNRLERCRLLVVGGGAELLDMDEAALRGVSIANCPRYCAISVAEHAFALLLSLARRLNAGVKRPQGPGPALSGTAPGLRQGMELHGKTLGLAGYGYSGEHLARIAAGFGMEVLVAVRNRPGPLARFLRHRKVRFVDFGDMLRRSDAVVSVLPPGARGLFNEEAFGRMRQGSLFVNVGFARGVDEDALRGALAGGILAGAGLDVFTPAGVQSLRQLENVILSPHLARNTAEAGARLGGECAENVIRFFSGRPVNLILDARPRK